MRAGLLRVHYNVYRYVAPVYVRLLVHSPYPQDTAGIAYRATRRIQGAAVAVGRGFDFGRNFSVLVQKYHEVGGITTGEVERNRQKSDSPT